MSKGHTFSIGFRIVGGRMDIDRDALKDGYRNWPDCDGTLTLEQDEAKRSNAANRYLFGVIYRDIKRFTGQDVEDIHDEMCVRFTTETINYTNPASGEIVEMEVVRRTSGMKVSQFHEFVQNVKLFASEFFGLTFEEPGEDVIKERERALSREKGRAA